MKQSSVCVLGAAIVASGLIAAAGCTKSEPDTPAPPPVGQTEAGLAAKQFFSERVWPRIGPCVECHSAGGRSSVTFLERDPEKAYEALERSVGKIASPSTSPLVRYVHADRAIQQTNAQISVLTAWLSLEATARGLQGAISVPRTVGDALKEITACMDFDAWEHYKLDRLAFSQTDTMGPCAGCHHSGEGAFWASGSSRETFEFAKRFPYASKWWVVRVNADGTFREFAFADRIVEKSNEACRKEKKEECHPSFVLDADLTQSIRAFAEHVLVSWKTGTCGQFVPDPPPVVDAGADAEGGAR